MLEIICITGFCVLILMLTVFLRKLLKKLNEIERIMTAVKNEGIRGHGELKAKDLRRSTLYANSEPVLQALEICLSGHDWSVFEKKGLYLQIERFFQKLKTTQKN